MLLSPNTFLSYAASYLGAMKRCRTLILCTGPEPTDAEFDAGYDPMAKTNRVLTLSFSADIHIGTKINDSTAVIEFSADVRAAAAGQAQISGTVTHAVLYRADSNLYNREYIVIPVGLAGDGKTITLNKLEFNAGESVQMLNFTHRFRRK